MKKEFLEKTNMKDKNGKMVGVNQIVDYMFSPDTIYKMKVASDMGLPVLTLIARELEIKFDENSDFPLVVTQDSKNAVFRQNVGRIAKFIMYKLGYVLVDGGLSERARIPAISRAKYFATSAIYQKQTHSNYSLNVVLNKYTDKTNKSKKATVESGCCTKDEDIKNAIEEAGYEVVGIE